MFSFAIPKLYAKKGATEDAGVKHLLELKHELVKAGYNPQEVDYMVKIQSGNKNLKELTDSELKVVITALEGQLSIARKAIELIRTGV